MKNPFETPSPALAESVPDSTKSDLNRINEEFYRPIESGREHNSGYISLPEDSVTLQCANDGSQKNIIHVALPDDGILRGVSTFADRIEIEKNIPKEGLSELSKSINDTLTGASHRHEALTVPIDSRMAFHRITVYENSEGEEFVAIPIIPDDTNQKFAGHAKNAETSLVRGNRYPKVTTFTKEAASKTTLLEQDKSDTIEVSEKTGLWTVQLQNNANGRYSQLKDAHVFFDPETATFEVLQRHKKITHDSDIPDIEATLPKGEENYVHFVASLNDLSATREGSPLHVGRAYLNNQPLTSEDDFQNLPEAYRNSLSYDPDTGHTILNELKLTPGLRETLAFEDQFIKPADTQRELNFDELSERIGTTFENVCAYVLNLEKNEVPLQAAIPENYLDLIAAEDDPAFTAWAQSYCHDHATVQFVPDFISADGKTLYEAKAGEFSSRSKEQLNRMRLYNTLNKGAAKELITITLDETKNDQSYFPGHTFKHLFNLDSYTQKRNHERLHRMMYGLRSAIKNRSRLAAKNKKGADH